MLSLDGVAQRVAAQTIARYESMLALRVATAVDSENPMLAEEIRRELQRQRARQARENAAK